MELYSIALLAIISAIITYVVYLSVEYMQELRSIREFKSKFTSLIVNNVARSNVNPQHCAILIPVDPDGVNNYIGEIMLCVLIHKGKAEFVSFKAYESILSSVFSDAGYPVEAHYFSAISLDWISITKKIGGDCYECGK